MKAKIEKDEAGYLWILVNGKFDDTAWAVTEAELIPIRDAINKYLEGK